METNQTTIVVQQQKSAGTAAALGLFFGPLGMLYSTGKGALIMFFVTGIVAFFTVGFGLLLTNPICAIWAYSAAKNNNGSATAININQASPKKQDEKETVETEDLFN